MALGMEDLAVGHWTDPVGVTGCTVVLPPEGNVASVSVRGGSPGTRETDLLAPQATMQSVSAVLLTGGSAFGLAAATGVAEWCEAEGIGFPVAGMRVPIVPAAVLFDLPMGDWHARPTAESGFAACRAATTADGPLGNVGAGMGATVGKLGGFKWATKGGLGHAVVRSGKVTVGALAVANAAGDVTGADGEVLAGSRAEGGVDAAIHSFLAPEPADAGGPARAGDPADQPSPWGNTTLGLVTTNAALTKHEVHRVASQAHDGIARAIRPAHTTIDGDIVFAVSAPRVPAAVDLIAYLAEVALADAIRAGVEAAGPVGTIPARGAT